MEREKMRRQKEKRSGRRCNKTNNCKKKQCTKLSPSVPTQPYFSTTLNNVPVWNASKSKSKTQAEAKQNKAKGVRCERDMCSLLATLEYVCVVRVRVESEWVNGWEHACVLEIQQIAKKTKPVGACGSICSVASIVIVCVRDSRLGFDSRNRLFFSPVCVCACERGWMLCDVSAHAS